MYSVLIKLMDRMNANVTTENDTINLDLRQAFIGKR